MRPKIREDLKTDSFDLKFTGSKSVIDLQMCAVFLVFVLHRLVALIADWLRFVPK